MSDLSVSKRHSWINLFHTYHLSPKFFKYSWQRITRGYADCDCWEIKGYLSEIIPGMLQHLRDNHVGSPCLDTSYIHSIDETDYNDSAWDGVLDNMILCWKESDDETCSMKNEFDDDYNRAFEEFSEKYGVLGEKLRTPEEIEHDEKYNVKTCHTIFQCDGYKDITDKWLNRELEIGKYKKTMQDKALDYLKQYFNDLWD